MTTHADDDTIRAAQKMVAGILVIPADLLSAIADADQSLPIQPKSDRLSLLKKHLTEKQARIREVSADDSAEDLYLEGSADAYRYAIWVIESIESGRDLPLL